MKRLLIIIFLLNIMTILFANNIAIKLGSGTETPGLGLALEARYLDFGLGSGIGFVDTLGYSAYARYYFLNSMFLSAGYGLLNFITLEPEPDVIFTSPVYGPFILVGTYQEWDWLYADYSLGLGYSPFRDSLVLTAQASFGVRVYRF